MTRSARLFTTSLTLVLLLVPQPAWAASGDPDTTFSKDGKAAFRIGKAIVQDSLDGVAVGADGRVVGVGDYDAKGTGRTKLIVVRLRPNGALDPTFSGDGVVTVGFPGDTWGSAVAVLENGKIVVVGANEGTSEAHALVFRFTASGALDPTFSGDGIATVKFPGMGYGADLAITGKKIVVGGTSERPGKQDALAVGRLTSSGAMDPTFSGDGVALATFGSGNVWASGLALWDGEPVVAGSIDLDPDYSYAAARFTKTGEPDAGFSTDGKTSVLVPSEWSSAEDVLVAGDGDVLVGGFTYAAPQYGHAFLRLTSAGVPDATFGGGDGLLLTDPTPGSDYFGEMAWRGAGVLVAGSSTFGGDPELTFVAYTAAGSVDGSFGGDGIVNLPMGPYSVAYAIAKTPGGDFVGAGRRYDYMANDVAFARVLGS